VAIQDISGSGSWPRRSRAVEGGRGAVEGGRGRSRAVEVGRSNDVFGPFIVLACFRLVWFVFPRFHWHLHDFDCFDWVVIVLTGLRRVSVSCDSVLLSFLYF
jgi:hypothetical protein